MAKWGGMWKLIIMPLTDRMFAYESVLRRNFTVFGNCRSAAADARAPRPSTRRFCFCESRRAPTGRPFQKFTDTILRTRTFRLRCMPVPTFVKNFVNIKTPSSVFTNLSCAGNCGGILRFNVGVMIKKRFSCE